MDGNTKIRGNWGAIFAFWLVYVVTFEIGAIILILLIHGFDLESIFETLPEWVIFIAMLLPASYYLASYMETYPINANVELLILGTRQGLVLSEGLAPRFFALTGWVPFDTGVRRKELGDDGKFIVEIHRDAVANPPPQTNPQASSMLYLPFFATVVWQVKNHKVLNLGVGESIEGLVMNKITEQVRIAMTAWMKKQPVKPDLEKINSFTKEISRVCSRRLQQKSNKEYFAEYGAEVQIFMVRRIDMPLEIQKAAQRVLQEEGQRKSMQVEADGVKDRIDTLVKAGVRPGLAGVLDWLSRATNAYEDSRNSGGNKKGGE